MRCRWLVETMKYTKRWRRLWRTGEWVFSTKSLVRCVCNKGYNDIRKCTCSLYDIYKKKKNNNLGCHIRRNEKEDTTFIPGEARKTACFLRCISGTRSDWETNLQKPGLDSDGQRRKKNNNKSSFHRSHQQHHGSRVQNNPTERLGKANFQQRCDWAGCRVWPWAYTQNIYTRRTIAVTEPSKGTEAQQRLQTWHTRCWAVRMLAHCLFEKGKKNPAKAIKQNKDRGDLRLTGLGTVHTDISRYIQTNQHWIQKQCSEHLGRVLCLFNHSLNFLPFSFHTEGHYRRMQKVRWVKEEMLTVMH